MKVEIGKFSGTWAGAVEGIACVIGCIALVVYLYFNGKEHDKLKVKRIEAFKVCVEVTKQPEACKKAVP